MSTVSIKQQQLLDSLKSKQLTYHLKAAGPDVKKTFEDNFSQLVDTIMDEHFPRLRKYDLGFQLIEKSPDNTTAFGIRALRLRSLAFIPFFYNNGTVSGYDVIYLPKLNAFVPSTESWIVFLTTNSNDPLGAPDERFKDHYTKLYPNLLPLRRPITFKTASQRKLLPYYLRKYASVGKRLYAFIDKSPWLLEKLAKVYGHGILDIMQKSASAEVLTPRYIRNVPYEEMNKKLRIYSEFQSPDEYMDLTIPEREELFKKGCFVKDSREEEEVSKAVPVLRKDIFFPVDSPGIYKVIDSEFRPRRVLVFYLDDKLTFKLLDTKRCTPFYEVRGMPSSSPEGLESNRLYAVERLGDFKDCDLLEAVPAGEAHNYPCVFDYTGKGYNIHYLSHESISQGNTNKIGIVSLPRSKKDGKTIVVLPKRCYVFKMDAPGPVLEEKAVEVEEYPATLISPNILDAISYPFETIKLSYDQSNGRYIFNGKAHSRFDTLKSLVMEYGLRESNALDIIRDAEFNKTARYWVKRAEPFQLRRSDNPSPLFVDAPRGEWAAGYPYESKLEADIWVPGLKRPQPIKDIMEPPSLEIMKKIKQLADSNDGEAFDLGLISSLLHTTNIDEYIPQIIKGLDSMCRILFVMYKHQDEVKDRYGEEDYKRIVESLKSNIETVGDLIVDLSQQKIDPYIRAMESEGADSEE